MMQLKKIRGTPGTKVKLTISRAKENRVFSVVLTRAIIQVKSVSYEQLENNIGYVRIRNFQLQTAADFVRALNDLGSKNSLKGLVLDLRNNPGGLLDSAVGVSAVILPSNKVVVSTRGRNGKELSTLKTNPSDYPLSFIEDGKGRVDPVSLLRFDMSKVPIVVLINSGSASASEIVTGALSDYKRALIVGERSFGKGSVQNILPLSNNGALKLTVALYYTPNNISIQNIGINPDYVVENESTVNKAQVEEKLTIRENELKQALPNPQGATPARPAHIDLAQEILEARRVDPSKDAQLRKALDLIKDGSAKALLN